MAIDLTVRFGADLSELERATSAAAKKVAAFGKDLTDVGKKLSASITAPLAGLATASVFASETVAGAMNTIRTGTGATGQDLEKLSAIFKSVYESVPVSAGQAATAVADLNTRLNLTGPELQAMAVQMTQLARVSGTEVGPLIQSVSHAFTSWGVQTKDQSTTLDYLWKVVQSTGISVTELSKELTTSGASLRAMGMPLENASALLGQLHKAGIPAEAAISGLNQAAARMAQQGLDITTGMNRAIDAIKSAGTESQAAQIAVASFGESGVKMADAIRSGHLDVQSFVDGLKSSKETIASANDNTMTLSDSFVLLKNRLTDALDPIGKRITVIIKETVVPAIDRAIEGVKWLTKQFDSLSPSTKTAIVGFAALVAAIGPVTLALATIINFAASTVTSVLVLKGSILGVSAALSAWWATAIGSTGAVATLAGAISGVGMSLQWVVWAVGTAGSLLVAVLTSWPVLIGAAAVAVVWKWDWLKARLIEVSDGIAYSVGKAWDSLRSWTEQKWVAIAEAIRTGTTRAREHIHALISEARLFGSRIMESMSGALDGLFDWLVSQWDAIVNVAQQGVDYVLGLWDSAKAKVGEVAAWMIDMAKSVALAIASMIGTSNASQAAAGTAGAPIPALAGGGIVTSPTLALIGEAGPEAVVPLGMLGSLGGSSMPPVQVFNILVNGSVATQRDLADQIRRELIRSGNRNGTSGVV